MKNMNIFISLFAICCVTVAQAKPGHFDFVSSGGGGDGSSGSGGDSASSQQPQNFQIVGVPEDFSVSFPTFELQEFGTSSHGDVGPEKVKVTKTVTVKEPKPYPVEVPHPVPVPVHVPKPVPYPVTKIVHVPKPYPIEVEKKVPIPIEVPKPYPVHQGGSGSGGYNVHDQSGDYSHESPSFQKEADSSEERK